MKLIVTIAFSSVFSLSIFGQKYDKAFLENQNKQLRNEIAELNRALTKSRTESQSTFLYVSNLEKKINTREKLVLNSEKEKKFIEDDIYTKQLEVNKLNRELADLKKNYGEVLVKSYKTKSVQNKILFVLSAKDFSQTIRRLKYLQRYAEFQDNKSEDIQLKLNKIQQVKQQKEKSIQEKNFLLAKQKVELDKLDGERKEKEQVVENYEKQQGDFVAKIRAKQAQTNKNQQLITKIINEEIAAAKKVLEEERKIALANKAKKDREEKEARDKAIKEAAEQKARQKKAEELAAKANAAQKAEAERLAKLEKEKTIAMEKKAATATAAAAAPTKTSADIISGNFEANKGRLGYPVDGGSVIIPFGSSKHPLDNNITIDNPGIDIAASRGAKAKSVYEGTVIRVFETDGTKNVMLSHGEYITVYNNLDAVYVKKGDKVNRGQALGQIYTNNQGETIMKFMLYKGNSKQNPSAWLN